MNATNKSEAVARLVKIWENKNAQRALRGAGLSTMALSLAACGSDSTDAVVDEPVVEEPVVTPVALELTTDNDLFDANDFTTAADTVTADQDTYEDADVIADATSGDGDTLTLTTDADISATPTVVGIENIVVNVAAFAAAGVNAGGLDGTDFEMDADGIASGSITINVTQLASTVDAAYVDNANAVTVIAGTDIATLDVTMNEDAGTIVDAGSADTVNVTATGADQVATLVLNGDAAGTVDVATDLHISATAASVWTINAIEELVTIVGDANTTIDIADLSGLDGATVTGVAGVVGAAAAITEDLTGIAATITFDADSSGAVADGANIVIDGTSGTDLVLDTDDGDDTTDSEATINVTVNEVATTAANTITLDNNGFGDDTITTINVNFLVAQTANDFVIDSDAADITVNLSGAVAVDLDTTDLDGELNASAMTGVLTASAHADLLTITGGSGDDVITAVTAAAYVLDGGAGDDTLATAADNTTGSFTGFEVLSITTGDDFMASQLSGLEVVVTSAGGITVDVATGGAGGDAIDIASIDFTGLTFADPTDTISVDLGNIDAAALLAGQAITYVGTDTAINDVTGGANGDTITGGALADVLDGGAGADTINGGAGADDITGGAGNDTLTGGAGVDDFQLDDFTAGGIDTITDFTEGAAGDTISFLAGAVLNDLSAEDYSAAATAQAAAALAVTDDNVDNAVDAANDVILFSWGGDLYAVIQDDGDAAFTAGTDAIVNLGDAVAADILLAQFVA